MFILKLITILFLITCIAIGAETSHHSKSKVDKLRFAYLAAGSLISLLYVVI